MSVAHPAEPLPGRQVALIDLLDRLLSGGVVLSGDIVISIADIDLVRVSLRALIVSVGSEADPLGPSAGRQA
ncbi:gas vesicle protein [Streptomyces zaomyceticus]|uniref:gas vesicle protein n=1 Tax=Streptomyces zaomyceticus TaxID=68286 RepID=UPI00342EF2F4